MAPSEGLWLYAAPARAAHQGRVPLRRAASKGHEGAMGGPGVSSERQASWHEGRLSTLHPKRILLVLGTGFLLASGVGERPGLCELNYWWLLEQSMKAALAWPVA